MPHGLSFLLIYGTRVKKCMERIRWTSFIVLSTVLALVMQLLIINSVIAQAQNTSLAQNQSATRIVDVNNNTIATIDPKTHQILNVSNFTGNAISGEILTPENATINKTLTMDTGNATTDETLTMDTGNATTEINLTDKFGTLQGK
jgi:hypothetical protein